MKNNSLNPFLHTCLGGHLFKGLRKPQILCRCLMGTPISALVTIGNPKFPKFNTYTIIYNRHPTLYTVLWPKLAHDLSIHSMNKCLMPNYVTNASICCCLTVVIAHWYATIVTISYNCCRVTFLKKIDEISKCCTPWIYSCIYTSTHFIMLPHTGKLNYWIDWMANPTSTFNSWECTSPCTKLVFSICNSITLHKSS